MFELFIKFITEFGIPIGIVLFFIIRDTRREERLLDYIKSLESFQKERLLSIIVNTTSLVTASVEIIKTFTGALINLLTLLQTRPCLFEKGQEEIIELKTRIKELEATLGKINGNRFT